jgi:PST family polysaccharide transporter
MDLRENVVRGSAYLALRQIVTVGISLAGVVLLTRLIGPAQYGRYVGALAIVIFLTATGRFGVDTFIIRRREAPDRTLYRTVLSVMAFNSIVVSVLGVVLAPVVIGTITDDEFVKPFQVLLLTLPVSLFLAPALARLERDLRYRPVALLELTQTVVFYTLAVALSLVEPNVWAPVIAQVIAQAVMLVGALWAARLPLGFALSRSDLRELYRYGLSYTASGWVADMRPLVNPIVVGHILGPAAVGYVSLALRITEMLRFAATASYRVSVSALAKIVEDRAKLTWAVSEGMLLLLLAVGPFLAAFALVANPLIPAVLGEEWEPTADVFPPIALAGLLYAVFSMQWSLLYVLGRNTAVLRYNLTNVGILVLVSILAVKALDDPIGYGIAELVSFSAVLLLHLSAGRLYGLHYRPLVPWTIAFVPPLAGPYVPWMWRWVLVVPLLGVLSLRSYRQDLDRCLDYLRVGLSRTGAPAGSSPAEAAAAETAAETTPQPTRSPR